MIEGGPDAARSRFLMLQVVLLGLFAVAVFVGDGLSESSGSTEPRLVATVLAAAILVIWAVAFARMIRGEDEMMHLLHLRAVAIGAGVVLFVATLAGLFADVLGTPGVPSHLLLPAFAVLYSVVLYAQGGRQR